MFLIIQKFFLFFLYFSVNFLKISILENREKIFSYQKNQFKKVEKYVNDSFNFSKENNPSKDRHLYFCICSIKFQKFLNNLEKNLHTTLEVFEDFLHWKILFSFYTKELIHHNSCEKFFNKKEISTLSKERNKKLILIQGKIHENFLKSMENLKISNDIIYTLINVLQKKIDFQKIQKNDPFTLIITKGFFNKEKSKIFAIRLRTQKKDFYLFCFKKENFFSKNAKISVHNFFCFPIKNKFRISSHFNLRRLNPVTKKITPHRGVDFAVPIGTPVLAAGNGKIIIAKKDVTAGNYVSIQHDSCKITRYMHLEKYFVHTGQIVKRGECIALSGNTGRSVGPHLHFEIWINKKAIDPINYYKRIFYEDQKKFFYYINTLIPYLLFS